MSATNTAEEAANPPSSAEDVPASTVVVAVASPSTTPVVAKVGTTTPLPAAASDADVDAVSRSKIAALQQEFNAQRARMKEIFLQKEADCRKLQSQLDEAHSQLAVAQLGREDGERRAQEEIVSLQQLVHETIEDSSFSKSEIERLLDDLERLRTENARLGEELSHSHQESNSSSNSLVPVISHVRKTIARKLGGDTSGSDYLEDSMRKVNKYAQEDAEVLRSLVVPLEEEIKALKEKLRTTDEELQACQRTNQKQSGNTPTAGRTVESALVGLLERPTSADTSDAAAAAAASTETAATTPQTAAASTSPLPDNCAACVAHTTEIAGLSTSLAAVRTDADHFRAELEREAALRRDLEQQWQEKREEHKTAVHTLDERVASAERDFKALHQFYGELKEETRKQLARLTAEREQAVRHLEQLQNDNDFLAGRFAATAAELQNERIDLPCTVEGLQESLLRCHEDLIETRVGYELEQRRAHTYFDEARLLAEKQLENDHNAEVQAKGLRARIAHLEAERAKLHMLKDTLQQRETEFERQATELRVQEIELRATNERLTQQNVTLRQKSSVLQQELANSETVQQDFVRLSQSLQVELEKIRAADSTVRWQDEDDVDQCPSCRSAFAVTRRQVNCRHCGAIYCEKCITKSVLSGRRRKPARVCDVCHTLLERNTAPYFSQAPPQSPT